MESDTNIIYRRKSCSGNWEAVDCFNNGNVEKFSREFMFAQCVSKWFSFPIIPNRSIVLLS